MNIYHPSNSNFNTRMLYFSIVAVNVIETKYSAVDGIVPIMGCLGADMMAQFGITRPKNTFKALAVLFFSRV
jgi:hypothetical protein